MTPGSRAPRTAGCRASIASFASDPSRPKRLATFPNVAADTAALPDTPERQRNIPYVYVQRRGETDPAREDFYTAARAVVETKARVGNSLVRREMVGQRRRTADSQGLEGPGQGYDYRPGKGTRTAQIPGLVARSGGATLAQITDATGWQPQSVRGFMANAGLAARKTQQASGSIKRRDVL